jgi:5-methylcytosine-specific restriction protein B
VENVKIYEVKSSASVNYLPLKSVETNSFYWNDAKFIGNKIGDYVFFVDRKTKEALFTKLAETGIQATFITERSEFVHLGKRFRVNGNFQRFVRFDIIETVVIPEYWKWTTPIGQSETYDLWREDKKLDNRNARIEKIEDLEKLFTNEDTSSILTQCVDLLKSKNIKPAGTKKSNNAYSAPSPTTNNSFPFQDFIAVSDKQKIGDVVTKAASKFAREHKQVYKGLSLKVSFGQGMATSIPWIAFLGYGQKVQEGFYPVFLYYKERKSLILSYGVSETRNPGSNWTIPSPLISIDSYFSSKGLQKPEKYGNSYIFKEYSTNIQLNESELMRDLDEVISIFNREFEYKQTSAAESNPSAEERETHQNKMSKTTDLIDFKDDLRQLLMAIKTKPFVLLAGISGIGKSRLARTLAYKTCALELLQEEQNPGNFLLIQVKPNWYDSTELLGYESNITGSPVYKPTAFVKFLIKAHLYPDIPFIVCLDEMNLAPVEQYLAEYLSAIESRRYENGSQLTDALVQPAIFSKASRTSEIWPDLNIENNKSLQTTLMQKGLSIPRNLVVIGTVNMDETTHSFSRKVLDRAMTIEINQVDLRLGLENSPAAWKYPHEFYDNKLVLGETKSSSELYKAFAEAEDLLACLTEINDILDKTPFKFAYRVRDESLAYCYYHASLFKSETNWFLKALDEIIRMKILSRIEGDETKCKESLDSLASLFGRRKMQGSLDKVNEMVNQLKFGYTSYFF